MAYQAKRKKQFVEVFELLNEEGAVVHTLQVGLDVDDMIVKINRKYAELAKTLEETTEIKRQADAGDLDGDCLERLENAVVNLFEAVFGQEDTQTIVSFYEGHYIEMCREVAPFIVRHVVPRCVEIRRENQRSVLQPYHRKQSKSLFRKAK